jgi:aspartate carbamoyltransferase catalytic subunit
MVMEKCFFGLPNVIESQQFDRVWLEHKFFPLARQMKHVVEFGGTELLHGKKMIALFYEPSTRTRMSFQMAMLYLGGQVCATENAREFSSAIKGETLADTIRVLCGYRPDVIVLRHYEAGSAATAVQYSSVPVINAGDGKGQHPTQALLDIFTIQEKLGHLDELSVAMVGDLVNGRTVRSLAYLLAKFKKQRIFFVSPDCAKMEDKMIEYLRERNVVVTESNDLREVAPHVDVVYQTRTQKERGGNFDRNDHSLGYFIVDRDILGHMKPDAMIMHPLPRVDEISPDVDLDKRAAYFEQAENGLYTRMALLKMILVPRA